MLHSHLTARPPIPYCHSERAQRAEESDRRAKAAGEENLCRLFPAAGAAVAARLALRRAALPTSRTSFVTKNPSLWARNFQQTPFVPRNGCFWARTSRRTHSDGQDLLLCLGPCPHIGLLRTSGGQDTRHEIRPCPLKCRGRFVGVPGPSRNDRPGALRSFANAQDDNYRAAAK